jgi:hypothetical protein
MNKLLQALLLWTLALTSYQSPAQSDSYLDHSPYEWVAPIATVDGRVRVTITKQKPKLYLAKSQRPIIKLSAEDDDTDYYDELPDLQIGYRRPELVNQTAKVHDDISDEVKLRLVLARKKALEKYHEKWGDT